MPHPRRSFLVFVWYVRVWLCVRVLCFGWGCSTSHILDPSFQGIIAQSDKGFFICANVCQSYLNRFRPSNSNQPKRRRSIKPSNPHIYLDSFIKVDLHKLLYQNTTPYVLGQHFIHTYYENLSKLNGKLCRSKPGIVAVPSIKIKEMACGVFKVIWRI